MLPIKAVLKSLRNSCDQHGVIQNWLSELLADFRFPVFSGERFSRYALSTTIA